jgi:hypothetical protein
MKKTLLVLVLSLVGCQAIAQYQGQSRAIQGYEIRSSSGYFGLTLGAEYFPLNNISFAPSVSFYIPATGNAWGVDLNARYYFTEESIQMYGLLGYGGYTKSSESNPANKTRFNSLNLGIGGMIKLRDELGINPEIRYQPINRKEFIFRLGIVYFIN